MFAMLLALVVSMFSAFWVALHPAYQDGAGVRFGGPAEWFALEGYRPSMAM